MCVCVLYVCVVCGLVACARVAIPSDCQRSSWEIYSTGQTTDFLYHFSRFLFFSPIQESDYSRRSFLGFILPALIQAFCVLLTVFALCLYACSQAKQLFLKHARLLRMSR